MKKVILIGVCAVTFLLCVTPIIPAQQYQKVKETIENEVQEQIESKLLKIGDPDVEPAIFRLIFSLILSLIGTIIGIIFGRIFGPLLTLFVKILTFPARVLAWIIGLIFGSTSSVTQ
jgi:hypothetical protein